MCGPCSVESEEHAFADRRAPRAARRGLPPRRGVQAAHLALRLPGARRARAPLDAPRRRRARDARRDRGARRGRRGARRRARGPRPGGLAQHAQLRAAQGHRHDRAGRPCSSAGWRRRSTSGSRRASTSSPRGAAAVVFCERGIRGFDDATRNLLDLGAVALLAHVHRVPVIVDPSHGAGRRDLVLPLARAALAAGAAGLMIEAHDDPRRALSDGPQAIPLGELPRAGQGSPRGCVVSAGIDRARAPRAPGSGEMFDADGPALRPAQPDHLARPRPGLATPRRRRHAPRAREDRARPGHGHGRPGDPDRRDAPRGHGDRHRSLARDARRGGGEGAPARRSRSASRRATRRPSISPTAPSTR